jgi:hypothetical protein
VLISSKKKSIGDFSSSAGDVRLQIAATREFGKPTDPVTAVERRAISTIRNLINLGSRFGRGPDGNLDVTGSTPEQIDLFIELEDLLPGNIEEIQAADGTVEVSKWSGIATGILERFEAEAAWNDFEPKQREFVDVELEPFLVKLIEAYDEDDEE